MKPGLLHSARAARRVFQDSGPSETVHWPVVEVLKQLAAGEIDALYTPRVPWPFLDGDPRVQRLFPDVRAAEESGARLLPDPTTIDLYGTPTLSPGELQRLRLATQVRSNLFGVVYVLDEPSAGLHPADTEALLRALDRL